MESAEGSERILVTCPPDVRRWLEESARLNGGTMSSEAVRAMRAQMAREVVGKDRASSSGPE
jgi:hypothetical protein